MSQFLEAVGLALSSIWANKLRSFMMVLGNIVAVTSIIAVVSLIQGMNGYVADAIISDVGAGTFKIDRVGVITDEEQEEEARRRNPNITVLEAHAVREASPVITAVLAESFNRSNLAFRETIVESVPIRGVSSEFDQFSGYDTAAGRLPSRLEIERSRPVALLGWDTADKLFKGRTAVDQQIKIRGMHFRVVGVIEKKGSMFGNSQDDFAIIPLDKALQLFGTRRSLELTVKPSDPSLVDQAMDEARLAMRIERRLRPRDDDNFGLYTSDTIMNLWKQFSQGAFSVLIGIVSLSLVVGGIVIMNIMLMVVSERTREIGLRKALGARRRDIMYQVLTESTTLSLFGGLVGTGLGFVLAMVIAAVSPLPAAIEPWSIVLGISMTAVVGLFFGLYPAMRAARLDPIEALRRE
ncbi:MAG: ABC transporter permease [Acidobacteria bacterium]|nr:ABC transporter permease [Acidobacteriota bacterium]